MKKTLILIIRPETAKRIITREIPQHSSITIKAGDLDKILDVGKKINKG